MNSTMGRMPQMVLSLCVIVVGLIQPLPLSAQEPKATIEGHEGYVIALAYSPDGKTLASGSTDKTIKLWDVGTGKERTTIKGHSGYVNSLAYSPDEFGQDD
jgi:WD40 repeat protein